MHATENLNSLAISATNHCLTGCVIGEVTGMAIGTGAGWGDVATMSLAIALAYLFGFSLTSLPLVRAGLAAGVIVTTALATDTVSITIMEAIDNLFIAVIPGALEAGLGEALFWVTLLGGFAVAYPFAWYANRYLLARGQGHAYVHAYHGHGGGPPEEPPEAPGVSWGVVAGALLTAGAVIVIVAVISSNRDHDGDEAQAATSPAQIDDDFVAGMVEHHELAVEMAQIAQQRGEHPEIGQLADAIVAAQTSEIDQMRSIHQRLFGGGIEGHEHGDLGLSHEEMGLHMEADGLIGANEFDRAFIDAMIPHHQGAIRMARVVLDQGEDEEIAELAEAIIIAQSVEIEQMNMWRDQWYRAPSPAGGVPEEAGAGEPAHEMGH